MWDESTFGRCTVKHLLLYHFGFRGKEFVLQGEIASQVRGNRGLVMSITITAVSPWPGTEKVHTEYVLNKCNVLNKYAFKHQLSLSDWWSSSIDMARTGGWLTWSSPLGYDFFPQWLFFSFSLKKKKKILFIFREEGEGEREGERHQLVASPLPPAGDWFAGQRSIHWATPAKTLFNWFEREKCWYVVRLSYVFIGWFSYVPWRDRTSSFSIAEPFSNQLSCLARMEPLHFRFHC